MDDMMEMMGMMKEMNSKMDAMMEKMGLKVSESDYMAMSDDQKDMKDEADMNKMKGM